MSAAASRACGQEGNGLCDSKLLPTKAVDLVFMFIETIPGQLSRNWPQTRRDHLAMRQDKHTVMGRVRSRQETQDKEPPRRL